MMKLTITIVFDPKGDLTGYGDRCHEALKSACEHVRPVDDFHARVQLDDMSEDEAAAFINH